MKPETRVMGDGKLVSPDSFVRLSSRLKNVILLHRFSNNLILQLCFKKSASMRLDGILWLHWFQYIASVCAVFKAKSSMSDRLSSYLDETGSVQ